MKRQTSPTNVDCRISRIPRNGQVVLAGEDAVQLNANDIVPNYGSVQYTCNTHHYINGSTGNLCVSGVWTNVVPKCEPKCDMRVVSSISHLTHCSRKLTDANVVDEPQCGSSDLVDPGIEVKTVCQRGYRSILPRDQITICQADGSWSHTISPCMQICGEEGSEGRPYIVGGVVTNNTRVPWHVGIYKLRPGNEDPEYICGGTILSPKVIVSAIHCFWDALNSRVVPINEFRIVAGKFYRRFNDLNEKNQVQVLSIAAIHHPPEYDHVDGQYSSDIAVVIIERHIEFKPHIAPVCIDYDLSYDERVVSHDAIGRVAGWGLEKANGSPSDTLKMIDLPVIERRRCSKMLDINFRSFLTSDKFCGGYKNHGVGLCEGDSGGGFVFPKDPDAIKPIFYLRGIVSTGPNYQGSCDSNEYTLFTNTAHFTELIREHDYANRPEYTNIVPQVDAASIESKVSCYACNFDVEPAFTFTLFPDYPQMDA